MDVKRKQTVSARMKAYRERLKKDPIRLQQAKEKRKVLNSKRKKVADMSKEEKEKHREKKKSYMVSYRLKLKKKKEDIKRESENVTGKIKNNIADEKEENLLSRLKRQKEELDLMKMKVKTELDGKLSLIGRMLNLINKE